MNMNNKNKNMQQSSGGIIKVITEKKNKSIM